MSLGGFSSTRLERMRAVMARHVERGRAPGIVTLVSRRGEVHVNTIGVQSLGGAQMRRDTIFRIASMSKPVIAVAALILVEECRLRLDEPVDELLPELADRRVLRRLESPLDDTVPARRPITLRDLLTLRMGFGQLPAEPDAYPILRAATDQQLGMGPPAPATTPNPDEWLRRLGSLPLMRQPGEAWLYNTGSDVLGVLVARAAGQPLGQFLRERIFAPLGMGDTGFSVPPEQLGRLATSYTVDAVSGAAAVYDPAEQGQWSRPPAFESGAGGLVSTADDYLAFGQMLLGGGRLGARRILARPTVALMTTDQLTPAQQAEAALLSPGRSWGFGISLVTRRDEVAAVPGSFGWEGGLGTSWRSDPQEGLVGLLLTQQMWGGPGSHLLWQDFWTSVYQAIDD